jgi:hypothetical protein
MFANRRHFREMQAGPQEGITSNILADRRETSVSARLARAYAGTSALRTWPDG